MYRILIFIFFSTAAFSQDVADTIRKIAIECNNLNASDQPLFNTLKHYKIICIGEQHGTKEPAEFLTDVAHIFTAQGRKVIVAFEIPSEKMTAFVKQRDSAGLMNTAFFLEKPSDGRNSTAWFRAINGCNKLGAQFCFFDGSNDESMFSRLVKCYENDTNSVLLTLSGNVHNKLLPYKNIKTMGYYLAEKYGRKVFSINHIYNEGTAYNRTSEGLKVRTIQPINNALTTSTKYERYFITNIFNPADGYNAYYYTSTVTASFPVSR